MSEAHDEDDVLLDRIAGGLGAITPRSDAGRVIGTALARRKRRRAATAVVTAAAVVAALGVGGALVARGVGAGEPDPASSSTVRDAFRDGQYAPAGFFSDVVGGTATPLDLVHHGPGHRTRGELFYASARWTPDGSSDSYLIDLAAERVHGSRAAACARLTMGAGSCQTRPDGSALVLYDVPAREAFYDPVHRRAAFDNTQDGVRVRGVTYLQADGLAISVWACGCSTTGGKAKDAAPLTDDELVAIAGDPSWNKD